MPEIVLLVLVADLVQNVRRRSAEIHSFEDRFFHRIEFEDLVLELIGVLGHHIVLVGRQVLLERGERQKGVLNVVAGKKTLSDQFYLVGFHVRRELFVRSAIAFQNGARSDQTMIDEQFQFLVFVQVRSDLLVTFDVLFVRAVTDLERRQTINNNNSKTMNSTTNLWLEVFVGVNR